MISQNTHPHQTYYHQMIRMIPNSPLENACWTLSAESFRQMLLTRTWDPVEWPETNVVLQPSLRCRRSTPCPIHICPISVKREYYCPPSGRLNPYLTNLSMNHYLRTYRHVTLLRLLYILYLGNWQRPTVCTLHLSAQTLLHVRTCWWCAYFNVTDKYEYKYIP